MKHIFRFCPILLVLLVACDKQQPADVPTEQGTIEGTIVEVNGYGQPIPSFTPADMAAAGFDYADLMEVTICDTLVLHNVPYVSSFNEVAILGPSFVDYNARGDDYGFAMLNGDFHYYIGGNVGDRVVLKISKKGGYQQTYELMKSVYQTERQPNETAEEYANFRMITTTNIARGVLYRSSNPLNNVNNAGRYCVADSLARVVGIRTEIDLADTPEKLVTYMASPDYASTYCRALYDNGKTIACGMMANTFCDDFKMRLGKAMRFIIDNEPPYLIHCNEGKDRCGFVSMLLEALAGADIDELRRDYMITMLNFYKIEDYGASYQLRQSLSIDRMIWLLCNEDALQNYTAIDWSTIDVSNIDWEGLGFYQVNLQGPTLQNAAVNYLKECGLAETEIQSLQKRLTTAIDSL